MPVTLPFLYIIKAAFWAWVSSGRDSDVCDHVQFLMHHSEKSVRYAEPLATNGIYLDLDSWAPIFNPKEVTNLSSFFFAFLYFFKFFFVIFQDHIIQTTNIFQD